MNCFHYTPGHLSLSRANLSWQKNNFWPSPHISLLSTLSLLKNWGWCFLHLLLVQHFHQTIHRSPRAENLPPCESVRFASVRSWVRIPSGPPKRRAPLCGALLFGIRRTFNSAQTNELLVHQGFRTAKTLVTRHSARFFVSRAAGGLTQG